MNVLNYILGMAIAYTSLWMNEMEYVWMNEVAFVFGKDGYLVEVTYVEPSFWEKLMSSPLFQSLMAYERMIWNMLGAICNILCAKCKTLSRPNPMGRD